MQPHSSLSEMRIGRGRIRKGPGQRLAINFSEFGKLICLLIRTEKVWDGCLADRLCIVWLS